jgi:phenylacetate-CoA ligase
VLLTALHNPEFPLLRYRIGDAAAISAVPCPCGRTLRTLELGVGRLEEMVCTRDGRRLHPRLFRTLYERLLGPALVGFHTVQRGPGRFTAHLELVEPLGQDVAGKLEREVTAYLREPVSLTIRCGSIGEMGRSASGKRRAFSHADD